MAEKETLNQKTKVARTSVKQEGRRFWTLVRMLLSDSMKLSFDNKENVKKSVIRIVTTIILFAAITALGYILYSLAMKFGIFSILPFIPEALPSVLSSIVIVFSVFNVTNGLVNTLYFSNDNRLMITYPCRGSTVFLARLFVYYINEMVRMGIVLVPILLSYVLVSKFPWFAVPWLLFMFAVVVAAVTLIGALFSIPWYYCRLFLKRNSIVAIIVYTIIFAAFIGVVSWAIGQIPDKIDIFTNFGPYFTKIQSMMKGYRNYCWFLYDVTKMMIGYYDGFLITVVTSEGGYTFLVFLAIIASLMAFSLFVVNRLYIKLASSSFEYTSIGSITSKHVHARPFFIAQFDKERSLLTRSPDAIVSIFGIFVFLPIVMALINKIFGAMDTNYIGNMFISAVNMVLILLIALVSNETIAHMYSDEGTAFALNRSYPRKSLGLLIAKLIVPSIIGVISLCVTSSYYYTINQHKFDINGAPWVTEKMAIYFAITLCCFYLGHVLFAASSDFCNIKSTFAAETGSTKNQQTVVITAFIIALSQGYLFYLYLNDSMEPAYLKMMVIGLVFFVLNIVLFVRKTKYIFGKGE
jgi:hypothetical protein